MLSIVIIETKDVLEKIVKKNESGDMWWEAPESKTHTEEGIPEALEMDKLTWDETVADMTCGSMVKNFRNWLAMAFVMGLWDGGTTTAIFWLGYGGIYALLPNFYGEG